MKHPLQITIEQANSQNRKAIIPYITAGFPENEQFWEILHQIDDCGVDIIEIGVPFSDPVADGSVIEEASRQAISQGVSLKWMMNGLIARAGQYRSNLVLMGYANPFIQYGLEKLAEDAKEANICGFIIPDVQLNESDVFRQVFSPLDIALIPIVSSNTALQRIKEYAEVSNGYIYLTSVLGITGGTSNLNETISETISRIKTVSDLPVALGFGLKHPSQLNGLSGKSNPDAVIMGSALLNHISKGKQIKDFFAPWFND